MFTMTRKILEDWNKLRWQEVDYELAFRPWYEQALKELDAAEKEDLS